MTAQLQQTNQTSPLAQSFTISHPEGSVITGVGIFFAKAPTASDDQLPITLELRPMVDAGVPSSKLLYKGTRVSATASAIRAVASTTFSSATEYKFTFDEPVYLEGNTEVAVCLRSNAPSGQYLVWYAKTGEFEYGSTVKRIASTLQAGSHFSSNSGTTWNADQQKDLALKVYRANFTYGENVAVLKPVYPALKKLTTNTHTTNILNGVNNPLVFTSGSNSVSVLHPYHGYQVGQKVVIKSTSYDSADIIHGIAGEDLLDEHLITAVDPFGYSFAATSNATSSGRGGGSGVFVTEQHAADAIVTNLNIQNTPYGNISADIRMPTYRSFASSTPISKYHENMSVVSGRIQKFNEPHYIANKTQIDIDGDLVTQLRVLLGTGHKLVAPHIYLDGCTIETHSNFIDYQDSASTDGRNILTTIPWVSETEPDGGTTASKYVSVPYLLQYAATSIRCYVDAIRPTSGDFTVWYRTNNSSSSTTLDKKNWVEFSKTSDGPNVSNYNDIPPNDRGIYSEYQFNTYDLPSFDQYQIKITMNSTNSCKMLFFKNLRTIATV